MIPELRGADKLRTLCEMHREMYDLAVKMQALVEESYKMGNAYLSIMRRVPGGIADALAIMEPNTDREEDAARRVNYP